MDFLEPNWKDGTRTGPAVASGYRAAYSAQNNQMGRMFNGGINPGGFGSRNYLLTGNATDPEPIVYVAVVDSAAPAAANAWRWDRARRHMGRRWKAGAFLRMLVLQTRSDS